MLRKKRTQPESLLLKALIDKWGEEQKKYRFPLIKTQVVIGWHIVDFLFPHKNLIVELDGKQHFTLNGRADDCIRDGYLKSLGFDILRYSNKDVLENLDEVVEYISLWGCLESPLRNYFQTRRILKREENRLQNGAITRIAKSSDF